MNYLDNTEKHLVQAGYEVMTPMRGKTHLRTEKTFRPEGYDNPISNKHAIFERDMWMVSQCDIFYLNLELPNISIGGMMELAVASYLHKHTIVVMGDASAHNHVFVLEAADIVFRSHFEAVRYLKNLVKGTSEEVE